MDEPRNGRMDCDRSDAGGGDGSGYGSQGNQMYFPHIRMGEGMPAASVVSETKSTVCDRGGVSEGYRVPQEVARALCQTSTGPPSSYAPGISANSVSGGAPRVMSLSDRRASLELRCLGVPLGRPSIPSGLVISKVNPGSVPPQQEVPIKDVSRLGTDVHRRNLEEMAGGGCDPNAIAIKERPRTIPQPTTSMGPPEVPVKSPTNRPIGSHNGEAPLHPGISLPTTVPAHNVVLGDPSGAVVSRMRVGLSPTSSGRMSVGDGVIISRTAAEAVSHLSTTGGHEVGSPIRRDVAHEKQERVQGMSRVVTSADALSSPPRGAAQRQVPTEGGILGQMLGHGILTNGEITLTPRSHPPRREESSPRTQGIKRAAEGSPGGLAPLEKHAVMDTVDLMERGGIPVEVRGNMMGLSIEMRSAKGVDAGITPLSNRGSNGFKMKEIRTERDEITIEPVLDPSRRGYGMHREQYLGQEVRSTESFANRYPLLREGLSKPCLRRRGRPPKMAHQMVGRSRRYMGGRSPDYTVYQMAQSQLSGGLNLPEGTVVSPSVSQQPRKSMSVDEVLSYYGSMQERKALGAEGEGQRMQQPRGESSMPANPETSMPAMQNSSLAQIESLVQSQIPSGTGFFPTQPTGMPQYPYLPNVTPSIPPTIPGYAAQMAQYPSQHMLMQGAGYYGMRYRGRGRPRGRTRARGRPRGSSGLYYHSTEREILPKPDYLPRQAEDVEEIVVEVDFKPEWEDEREAEMAKEDSLSEAQKLVPNWISVVPAKMQQSRRSANLNDEPRDSPKVGSVLHAPEVAIHRSRGSAPEVTQRQVVVPEELEVCPSVEAVLGHLRPNDPVQAPMAEPEAEETSTLSPNKVADHAQRMAEKQPKTPEVQADEPAKTVSDSDCAQERLSIEATDVVEGGETTKVDETGAMSSEDVVVVLTEDDEREKDPVVPVEETALGEVRVKTEVVDDEEVQEVVKEVEVAVKKRTSARERREKYNQLASSLASIKSLPKDVTVVRSRGKGSPFVRSPAFPESPAAHLGPSIEIRRVRGRQRSSTRDRRSSKDAAEVTGVEVKTISGKDEVEEADLLARIPALSKILSMGTSTRPTASNASSYEAEGGEGAVEGKVMEVKVEPDIDSDMEAMFGATDGEEPEDDLDETYQPARYRGGGRRRRGRGRRGSATRVDVPQQPRQRRVGRRKRSRVKVKVEEEERPGDWDVFVCDLCGRSFSKRFRLAHHIRAYHPMPVDNDGRARRVFPCQQCSKAFTRMANLKKHLRIHTGEKPFVCEECGRAFTFSKNLAQHRRVHGIERPFVCEVCGHAFRFSKNLSQHRGVHAHLKPHVCTVCGRGFSRSTHLSQHKRLHSGEKPFRCSVCGKRFAQRGHAALHTRIHTGERPYACPVCGRAFSLRAHLVRHVALHQRDGEMGPGRPPPLPRRDRRGRDGVELVGADEDEAAGAEAVAEDDGEQQAEYEEEGAEEEEYYEEEEYVEGAEEELGEGESVALDEEAYEETLEEEEEAYDETLDGQYEEPLEEGGPQEEETPGDTEEVAEGQLDQDVMTTG